MKSCFVKCWDVIVCGFFLVMQCSPVDAMLREIGVATRVVLTRKNHQVRFSDDTFCKSCKKIFETPTALETHISTQHTFTLYECKINGCQKRYPNKTSLFSHFSHKHQISRDNIVGRYTIIYFCPLCTKEVFDSKKERDEHFLKRHKQDDEISAVLVNLSRAGTFQGYFVNNNGDESGEVDVTSIETIDVETQTDRIFLNDCEVQPALSLFAEEMNKHKNNKKKRGTKKRKR